MNTFSKANWDQSEIGPSWISSLECEDETYSEEQRHSNFKDMSWYEIIMKL